jgi:hypothetical protein
MSKTLLAALLATGLSVTALPVALATAQQMERDDDVCQDHLGGLKRVTPAELAGVVESQRVWVTEYCMNHFDLPDDGNAGGLRSTIADNEAMVRALRQKGYSAGDVFGVKMMGDDTVTLYVHR